MSILIEHIAYIYTTQKKGKKDQMMGENGSESGNENEKKRMKKFINNKMISFDLTTTKFR